MAESIAREEQHGPTNQTQAQDAQREDEQRKNIEDNLVEDRSTGLERPPTHADNQEGEQLETNRLEIETSTGENTKEPAKQAQDPQTVSISSNR